MNGKCQFHHNRTESVFYGTLHCFKSLKSRTLNTIQKPRKSLFSKRKRAITQER